MQWYPGHIAKTEKELKEQLKLMDVVIEVRDARIPLATSHPKVIVLVVSCIYFYETVTWDSTESVLNDQMDSWLGNRRRIIVMNREDMVSTEDRNVWGTYFASQGVKVVYSNGQLGMVR